VVVILDSDHTHEHVLKELELYNPFVGRDSYIIVMDTGIENASENISKGHPWGKGNNPKTAVWDFLKRNHRFEIDQEISDKLLITAAPDGYLRCIRD
jgi:cephalosporin hydroxylase